MKRKIPVLLQKKPDLAKFWRLNETEATFYGKVGKVPLIRQSLIGAEGFAGTLPHTISRAINRLKKAGVLVPEYASFGTDSFYSRLGSKRRSLKANNLMVYMQTYFSAINRGNKPNTGTFNKLLDSAASAIGKMQACEVIHFHPHFQNLVVSKNKVGIIDFKLAVIKKVDWSSANDIINKFGMDFAHLNRSWNDFETFFKTNPKILRVLWRRKKRFFEKVISQYPASKNVKAEVLGHYLWTHENIKNAQGLFF